MGTEVLRPQDVLVDRFHVAPASFHRRRNFSGTGNLTNIIVSHRKPNNHSGSRKTSPKPEKKKFETRRKDDGGGNPNPAVGQKVTLLRRGESLDSFTSKIANPKSKSPTHKPIGKPVDDLAVLGTGRIGPESPEIAPKQMFSSPPPPSMYAGSAAFSMSPSPQSLPVPSFFNKKQHSFIEMKPFVDDSATRDLRRLLRLE